MKWTGRLIEFRDSNDDFNNVISYGGRLELQLSVHSAIQTKHILPTIRATRRIGQYS
jgi:hypothetical protein